MRVSLVFPQLSHVMRGRGPTFPPNAVFTLAAVLRARGHEVTAHVVPRDDLFTPRAVAALTEGCDLLGLSANSINWRFARRLSQQVRALRPELPQVLGGIHPSLYPERTLRTTPADHVIRGEAEEALPELVAALEAGRGVEAIAGLAWRGADGQIHTNAPRPLLTPEQLAAQPPAAFDLLPRGIYQGVALESSRGCAFSCAFCSIPYRRSFRALSAEAFVDRVVAGVEMAAERIVSPFAKIPVYILDDCFTTHKKRALEVLERLEPLADRICLGLEARADQVTGDLARALSPFDLWLIQMGLESGYAEGLTRVDKKITLEDIERACTILQDHGLSEATDYAFIVGFPWESRDDCLRTLEFAMYLHMRYGGHVSVAWYEPFPGSLLWERREEEGFALEEGIFDDAERDWREDEEIFHRLRPRMSRSDIDDVEDVITSIACLDPKYLWTRVGHGSGDSAPRRVPPAV